MRTIIFAILVALVFGSSSPGLGHAWNFQKRGCSYYPKSAAWDSMWTNFDPTIIDRDFEELKVLGCNFIRIILRQRINGFYDYGSQYQRFNENFETLLTLADKHQLLVHAVVFDAMSPSDFTDINLCKTWIDSVVAARANDRRIFRWELFSELNLVCRDDNPDTTLVINWYKNVFPYLKKNKGESQDATISVGILDNAYTETKFYRHIVDLSPENLPDVYGLVFTKYAFLFPAIYDTIKSIIRKADPDTSKKIAVIELAWDTYNKTDFFQRDQFRNMFWYLKEKAVDDVGIWTLWDFSEQDLRELDEKKQRYCGLRRNDDSYKPAYDVVYAAFHGQNLVYDVTNASFEVIHDNLKNENVYPAQMPDSWIQWKASIFSSGIVRISNDYSFTGNNSIKMSQTNKYGVGAYYEQGIPVIPGKTYKLRAFSRTANATGSNFISIVWHKSHIYDNRTWAVNKDRNSTSVRGNTDWKMLEVIARAPDSCILAQPYCKSLNNQGEAYFDYFSFTPMFSVAINAKFNEYSRIDFAYISFEKIIEPFYEKKSIKFKVTGGVKTLLDAGWYKPTIRAYRSGKAIYTDRKDLVEIVKDTSFFFSIGALPDRLFSFKGFSKQDSVVLFWETEVEQKCYGFEISRTFNSEEPTWLGFVPTKEIFSEDCQYHFIDYNLQPGLYEYVLKEIDYDGFELMSMNTQVEVLGIDLYSISAAYPNPFNSATTLVFTLPELTDVKLIVYDILGRKVARLVSTKMKKGRHKIKWKGRNDSGLQVASGIYYIRLKAGAKQISRKVVLIR